MSTKFVDKIKQFASDYWPLLLIVVSFAAIVIPHLRTYGFWDWDECVYTQYARTMRDTGNFLTNQWGGKPVFDKPTLTGILIQLFSIPSVTEVSARLTIIFVSIFLLGAVYIFAKKYFSTQIAVLSILFLFITGLFVIYAIRVNTDIIVTLFTFLGVFFWVGSYRKSWYSYISGIFFGLAVLSKGLSTGPYFTAIFISLLLLPKRKYFINFFKMLLVFLLVILPWHLYEYLTYGSRFTSFYFYENIIKRAQNPLEFHFEGRSFYFKLIYNNFFPWIFFALVFPVHYLIHAKNFLKLNLIKKELEKKRIIFSILLLIVVPLVMITSIKTRIAWYVLPIYPFIAIFLGYYADFLLAKLPFRKILFSLILIFLIVHSYSLLSHETTVKNSSAVTNRNTIFTKTKLYPHSTIDYLVQYSERRARETLAPNLQTSITFIYGGNPCAVFYSEKKVNYYYSTSDFIQRVKRGHGIYVVENGDLHFIKNLSTKLLYQNSDYTLFTN